MTCRRTSKAWAASRSPVRSTCKGRVRRPAASRIFICHPSGPADEKACAEKILSNLAHRAYRRPVMPTTCRNCSRSTRWAQRTAASKSGVRLALQKILVSPDFLFRAELDPPDAAPGTRLQDQRRRAGLTPVVLPVEQHSRRRAARRCRERAALTTRRSCEAQVKRMLADPRSQALVKNFAGQWLFLRNIARISPDHDDLPDLRRESARGAGEGNRAPDRKPAARGSQRRRPAEHGLHVPQSSAWPSTTGSRASTAASSAA